MAKEIFDQVSAVMWGQNALDYYANYIAPRTSWSDSDIRKESHYFAGLAHGLRVRAASKRSQNVISQDNDQIQPRSYVDRFHFQLPPLPFREHCAGSSAFQSRAMSQSQPTHSSEKVCGLGSHPLFPGVQENKFRSAPPPYALSTYQPQLQRDTDAKISGYFRNTVYPGNKPHMPRPLSASRANIRQPAQEYNLDNTTAGSVSEEEPANDATAQSNGWGLPDPFGTLSVPYKRARSVDITNAHAPQFRRPAPLHFLTSELLVEAREDNDAHASTVEDQPEESSEEDYPETYTLSIKEETSDDGEFDESGDELLRELAAGGVPRYLGR